ncbi:MAG: hypothetical protein AB7G28_13760 [Pirellulales bacterium]
MSGAKVWAANFGDSTDETIAQIQRSPDRFAKSEYATDDFDARFAIVSKFHYVIHFVIESDEVVIASVAHGARRPGYWLRRVRK